MILLAITIYQNHVNIFEFQKQSFLMNTDGSIGKNYYGSDLEIMVEVYIIFFDWGPIWNNLQIQFAFGLKVVRGRKNVKYRLGRF